MGPSINIFKLPQLETFEVKNHTHPYILECLSVELKDIRSKYKEMVSAFPPYPTPAPPLLQRPESFQGTNQAERCWVKGAWGRAEGWQPAAFLLSCKQQGQEDSKMGV